jgi:glycosyltransferase involved in cell wall biosynthesis
MFNIYRYQHTLSGRINFFIQNNILGYIAVLLASQVIVLGPRTEQKLSARGVSESKIHIIPQPPQVEEVEHPKPDLSVRSEHEIPEDAHLVLYVGRFSREKGAERLVKTIRYVTRRKDNIHFLLVGSGGEKLKFVQESLNNSYTHFVGHVEHEILHHYYKSSDVFLQTSNTEGLPNTVLEALYFGLPIISPDSGGEVLTYVSNIGDTYTELGQLVIDEQDRLQNDSLPRRAEVSYNKYLYRTLFSDISRSR